MNDHSKNSRTDQKPEPLARWPMLTEVPLTVLSSVHRVSRKQLARRMHTELFLASRGMVFERGWRSGPWFLAVLVWLTMPWGIVPGGESHAPSSHDSPRYNVLFIIADDLTATALSCYGNEVCRTPNLDQLAAHGVRFTRAYCNATYCGPSRASFLSGHYPHSTRVFGYESPRKAIGSHATWPQHFRWSGYHAARVGAGAAHDLRPRQATGRLSFACRADRLVSHDRRFVRVGDSSSTSRRGHPAVA